ncbi:hypothetical protein Mal15_54960 [Stieleria maiorica]|uniref:Uncharacterized protein n=1 Tax=Stieleria maiorica TaxID=2795974 RepID=A0A5B9MLY2_9BACT|nr:hypothetical protein Mal15_54960 [Stieleria maiorica]
MNRSATNPYVAPKSSDDVTDRRPRWLRNIVILNMILLLLPLLLMMAGYILLRIAMATANGGIYDVQLTGVSNVTLWPLVLYLMIPNLVLFCWMLLATRRRDSTD